MPGIRKNFLQFIFSGSCMKRWNDKLRPSELIEIDKQAHKMFVAWMLCLQNGRRLESDAERLALAEKVIEGGIFDYLYRLVVTDIKPPVFYRIKATPEHYRQLNEWVIAKLAPRIRPVNPVFWERFVVYCRTADKSSLADRILDAAHHYASYWEFSLIKDLNSFDAEVPKIEEDFKTRLHAHRDLEGVGSLLEGSSSSAFHDVAALCGQLRFQKRWSQTPRIPETSVLGHMFIVACYAFFFSLEIEACPARRVNNFFAGLLHDLPEVLTRDIISPVKKSVDGLDALIRAYEEEDFDRRIINPLKSQGYDALVERLGYFLGLETGSEFDSTVREGGQARKIDCFEELQKSFNADRFDPKDGELLKACDHMAAFMEAYTALRNGIASEDLQQALWRLREDYRDKSFGPLHLGALLADFD